MTASRSGIRVALEPSPDPICFGRRRPGDEPRGQGHRAVRAEGVLACSGGEFRGWSLFLEDGRGKATGHARFMPKEKSLELDFLGYRAGMGVRYPDQCGRSERLERELAAILERIVDDDTEQVILFGSAARGDVGSTSDLDLLVVRHDTRRAAERTDDLYRRARPSVAMDLLVYTPAELAAARETSSFLRRILREGRIVHERRRP